jgi:hypothetical protein
MKLPRTIERDTAPIELESKVRPALRHDGSRLRDELNRGGDKSERQQSRHGREAAGKHAKSIPCRM